MRDPDKQWRELQMRSLEEARQQQWGIYCNTLFEMAQFLEREGRKELALDAFMAAVYISLNGPNNLPFPLDRELARSLKLKRWELEFGLPITGHVFRIGKLANELGFGIEAVKQRFQTVVEARKIALKTPMSFRTAWRHVRDALDEDNK